MKRARKARWVTVLLAVGIVLLGAVSVWAATLEVGPGKTYTTIQAAINAANDGDTIEVASGTYAENATVNKGVSLVGEDGAVLQGTGSGNGFLIQAADVTIEGFEITNYNIGIRTYGGPASYGDLTVTGVNVHDNVSNGICILYDSFDKVAIVDSQIVNTTGGNGIGIANGASIAELVVENSTISASRDHNVYMNGVNVGAAQFTGCQIVNSTRWAGVMIAGGASFDELSFTGGAIADNGDCGLCVSQGASSLGVLALDGVTLTGHGESGAFFGAGSSADSVTIKDCTFQSNAWEDIDLSGGWFGAFTVSGDVLITGNSFNGGAWCALYIGDQGSFGSLTVVENTINRSGNRVFNTLGALADASGNWWSDPSGPLWWFVSGNVAYSPWLAVPPGSSPWLILVDDIGPKPGTGFVSRAFELARDGDTIQVLPGNYIEDPIVNIVDDVLLVGSGASATTIQPGGDTGTSGDSRAWFLVDANATLNIGDMTFDAAGKNVHQAFRWKGDGSVTDCSFANIIYSTYLGFALVPFGGAVDVTGSTFENIGRVGVLYFGPGVTGSTYSGNTYVGKGAVDGLDYAVELGGGAVVTIQYSDIRENTAVASSDGSTSAGILVTDYYGPGTAATIMFNILANNTTGIAVGYLATDASSVVARYNSMFGNEWGIASTGPLVDAALNWWGDVDGPSGEGAGVGDQVSTNVIFSPWLGIDPDGNPTTVGVQLVSPMLIIVDDVGPAPGVGYLNAAIGAANSADLPGTDTIEVRHGTYDGSEPITQAVNIVSETGSASHTTLNGNMSINGNGVLIGLPLQGFRVNGNLTVGAGANAATSRINWCDFYGLMTNNGTGTFDAQYNYWGTQEVAVVDGRTTGDIDYDPFLPKNADDSYVDATAIIAAGLAVGIDPAIDQLWLMVQLGQDVGTFIQYQGVAGAGAFGGAPVGAEINLGGAAGGGGAVEGVISGTYTPGDPIDGRFTLTDPVTGEPITDAAVTTSLLGPDGALVFWGCATYDETTGEYVFTIDTSGLAPGTYELIIQTDDGQSKTVSIEVLAA